MGANPHFCVMKKGNNLSAFVKENRQKAGFTQETFAKAAGVGLRFVRELEQGKNTLRMDKVNQVLGFFQHQLGPVGQTSKTSQPIESDKAILGSLL